MNNLLAFILFVIAIIMLAKPLATRLWSKIDKIKPKLGRYGLITIISGLLLLLLGLSGKPRISALDFTLVFLGAICVIEGLLIRLFPQRYLTICASIMKHYFLWMIPLSLLTLCLSLFVLTRDYIGPIAEIDVCEDSVTQADERNIDIYCGVSKPEDLVLTPDNNYILISEFSNLAPLHEASIGGLKLFNLTTEEFSTPAINFTENSWGDTNCKVSETRAFSPHGIDLVQRDDGRYQFAIISHAPRESIELFELVDQNSSWNLIWRGCIIAPEGSYLNDVALHSDGSLYTTHMFDINSSLSTVVLQMLTQSKQGYVLQWSQQQGFTKLPNTQGSMPNGITYNQQENILYIAFNFGNRVGLYDVDKQVMTKTQFIQRPDNMVYDGTSLWITSLDSAAFDDLPCIESPTCPLPFSVTALNSNDLTTKKSYSINADNFGMVTVALPANNKLWLGTFQGDRLASINR